MQKGWWVLYDPPTWVKTCEKGGGFYMTHPLGLKLAKKVVGSIGAPMYY